jgi:serine/threonine protein kinase
MHSVSPVERPAGRTRGPVGDTIVLWPAPSFQRNFRGTLDSTAVEVSVHGSAENLTRLCGNMRDEKQAAVQDPLIGQVFGGKYSMRRLIGRGGVGLVYLAEDISSGDEVVIKLLSPDWSRKPEAVRRFEREAERLAGVRHPNIVRLLDQGHEADRAYLVMEYLQGELLSDTIADHTRLDLQTFVPIAAQVLKGIGHAHSRGVMIRDIKPANIMLCERKGRANFVKILDFGLAKLTRDERPVTEEHVLGTAGYLAPEVIQGASTLDLRVDVFSLGALFYKMLSGQLPFEGDESATVFYKTIHDDPKGLHEALPTDHDVPEGLIALVHACLSKDPAQRPDDANAIVEQLIDVVPASLFRLPKVATPGVPTRVSGTGEVPRAGYGNTGMVQLVGDQAISGRHQTVPAALRAPRSKPKPKPSAHAEAKPEPVTLSAPGQDPDHTGPIPVAEPHNGRAVIGLLAAGVLLLGGATAYLLTRTPQSAAGGTKEASVAAPRNDAGAPTPADDVDYEEQLVEARTLIEQGELEAASELLDGLRGPARRLPDLAGRVERADDELIVAKLMAAGSSFEQDNKTAAAVAAYRDVLEVDAGHVGARARLAALAPGDALPERATPPTPTPAVYAPVDIGSRPLANLFIDGEARGTTPFVGKLSVGTHEIRMTARGYTAWEGTLEVRESGTEDLRVRLEGKGGRRRTPRGPESAPERPGQPKPQAQPQPNPKPDPEQDPKPPAPPKGKSNSVFLPTKDKTSENGGGVFLPTKD